MTDSPAPPVSVLDALDCAYFEVDKRGHLTYANPAYCAAEEVTLDEIKGQHFRHLISHHQVAEVFRVYSEVFKSHEIRKHVRFNFRRHKSGGYRLAEGTVGPIFGDNGEVVGFRTLVFDETDRIQFEAELLAAKKSAESELSIGRSIQQSFLPPVVDQIRGWDIDVRFYSAREVAGDFYDVFPMSGGTRLGFVVADVCDKGVGAAMYMAIFRTLIRAFANVNLSTSLTNAVSGDDTLQAIADSMVIRRRAALAAGSQPLMNAIQLTNQYFARIHGASNMFATMFVGVLNPQDGKLLYINAGHDAPLLVSAGAITTALEATGPAVGLMEDMVFEIQEVIMSPGDVLFAYTDGMVDARNESGESYGEQRLRDHLIKYSADPDSLLSRLTSSLHAHIADGDQFDDVTMLRLLRNAEE